MKMAPTQIPPGGMGNGLERAYSKNDFIYNWLQNQRTEIIINFLVLIQDETKILQLWKNFEFFGEKGDPWGDLNAPKATSDSSFLYFLSGLIKYSEHVRIKNSHNHFKSSFGSAYLISKQLKLNQLNGRKGNQGKKAFLGILACCLCNQLNCTDIVEY